MLDELVAQSISGTKRADRCGLLIAVGGRILDGGIVFDRSDFDFGRLEGTGRLRLRYGDGPAQK